MSIPVQDPRAPEHGLVMRCLRGDGAAWEILVKTYTRRVYLVCYRFTEEHNEAQDLTQEVFFRVCRTLASFRADDGAFSTWLMRLTRNLLIDHYRRNRQQRLTDSIEDPAFRQLPSTGCRTEGLLARREASELLERGLQKLTPELRTTVVLRDLRELGYREIAAVLRIPEGTVKSRLNRARAELSLAMRPKCQTCR